jgi:hypothetical protein
MVFLAETGGESGLMSNDGYLIRPWLKLNPNWEKVIIEAKHQCHQN